jgi:hypothetical protein
VIRNELPFATVPEWLLRAPVSDRAVRLYGILIRYADREGHAFPSRRRLAEDIHCSESSLDRAVKELVHIHALKVHKRRSEAGDWDRNDYLLTPGGVTHEATGGVKVDGQGGVTTDSLNESHVEREKPLAAAPRPRTRDELFEALCDVENIALDELTDPARGVLNRAAKALRKIDATPEQVRAKAAVYRRVHPTWDLTVPSLVKHWPSLSTTSREPAYEMREPRSLPPLETDDAPWAREGLTWAQWNEREKAAAGR